MDSNGLSDYLIKIVMYLITPIGAFIAWSVKKKADSFDKLLDRMAEAEQSRAVMGVVIKNIESDVSEIKDSIKTLVECSSYRKRK